MAKEADLDAWVAKLTKEQRKKLVTALKGDSDPDPDPDMVGTVTELTARLEAVEAKIGTPPAPNAPPKSEPFWSSLFGGA